MDVDRGGTSVIGSDLIIKGQQITIISKGSLQIDGEIRGDVHSAELVVGEQAQIVGTIAAENVSIFGHVVGAIRGLNVALHSSARVEGDVYHQSLTVEEGAVFDGGSRRPKDPKELLPKLDPAETDAPPAAGRASK